MGIVSSGFSGRGGTGAGGFVESRHAVVLGSFGWFFRGPVPFVDSGLLGTRCGTSVGAVRRSYVVGGLDGPS
jgi:hypothetical protein